MDISRFGRAALRLKENDPTRAERVCHHRVGSRVATRGSVDFTVGAAQRWFALKLMTNQTCKFQFAHLTAYTFSPTCYNSFEITNFTFYKLIYQCQLGEPVLCVIICSCDLAFVLKVRAASGLIASLRIKQDKNYIFIEVLEILIPNRPVVAEASIKCPAGK